MEWREKEELFYRSFGRVGRPPPAAAADVATVPSALFTMRGGDALLLRFGVAPRKLEVLQKVLTDDRVPQIDNTYLTPFICTVH